MSKTASIVTLVVVILGIVAFGLLGFFGMPIDRFDFLPFSQSISQGLDLRGGVYAVYEAEDPATAALNDKISSAIEVMRNRLDAKGYTEATLSRQGSGADYNRIRVEIPGVNDPEEVFKLIGEPALLEFVEPNGKVIMTGENITKAFQGTEGGKIIVNFQLNDEGARAFGEATSRLINQSISIRLDGKVISSPNVLSAITGGSGYIEGNFDVAEAQRLALQLQSGAIPVKLKQYEARTISATLGVDALNTSVMAGAIGVLVLLVFMLAFYRLPGLLADIALLVYILLVLYILAITQIQLTLPGIAGIILSIGMAVDANVIIFARIREEMALGKTLRSAVDSGFKKAFVTIADSNITTIIAAVVLMVLGTGSIKGFAYTLSIGVLTSMFTAITVTRFLMETAIKLNLHAPWLYNVPAKKEAAK